MKTKEEMKVHPPYKVYSEDKKNGKWKIEVYYSRLEIHTLSTKKEAFKLYNELAKLGKLSENIPLIN